jgi:hypothetical protein
MNEVNNCNKPLYEQSVRLPAAIISIQKVQNRDTQDLEYSIQLRYMPVIDRSVTGIAMKGNAWVVYNRKVEVISFVVQFGSQTNLTVIPDRYQRKSFAYWYGMVFEEIQQRLDQDLIAETLYCLCLCY